MSSCHLLPVYYRHVKIYMTSRELPTRRLQQSLSRAPGGRCSSLEVTVYEHAGLVDEPGVSRSASL